MESAPRNEGPISPVPESAQQENDESIPDNLPFRTPAAAERDIDVIAEPRGQGDMPTPPELRDVPAEIGDVEVPHQFDTE